jgi:16S rRNA (guanine(1405)-N(7))-methyltransferase
MSATPVADVVSAVQTSRRYQWVAPEVLARLAAEEIPKSRNQADAQKRTKRRLHQIFGAYAQPLPYASIAARIADAPRSGDELESLSRWVLGLHASTRERLPYLITFYADIFAITGLPRQVLDVACGLNPFAWPWMGLDPNCQYIAFDIDLQITALVDEFLSRIGIAHDVQVRDALSSVEMPQADVALLLKAAPCLEQQRTGAGLEILDRIDAPHVVFSYPTHSLSGRGKGMLRTYRAQFEHMLAQRPWRSHELEFPSELVFIVDKRT